MTEPKFQWSSFLGNNKQEQFVVRTDTFNDFLESIELVKKLIASSTPVSPVLEAAAGSPATQDAPWCPTCGSKMEFKSGTSKTCKPYKGYFCPTGLPDHKPVWVK